LPVRVEANLAVYFDERIREAAVDTETEISVEVAHYLTELLAEKALRGECAPGGAPLALELVAARTAEEPEDRLPRLRAVGDAALYECGFFPDHVERRGVSRDYVIDLGSRAYGAAETLVGWRGRGVHPYGELARAFPRLARLLDEVRERTSLRTTDDVVRLCDRYRETGSPAVATRLIAAGVLPQLSTMLRRGLA